MTPRAGCKRQSGRAPNEALRLLDPGLDSPHRRRSLRRGRRSCCTPAVGSPRGDVGARSSEAPDAVTALPHAGTVRRIGSRSQAKSSEKRSGLGACASGPTANTAQSLHRARPGGGVPRRMLVERPPCLVPGRFRTRPSSPDLRFVRNLGIRCAASTTFPQTQSRRPLAESDPSHMPVVATRRDRSPARLIEPRRKR
jgi:hypothetical protein